MKARLPAMLFAAGLLPAAYAQFQLSAVTGGVEQPVGSVYDFGTVAIGDSATAHFRLRNTSTTAAMLTILDVAGTGFVLSGGPSLPATLMPQATVDLVVTFSASLAGSYSAAFSADGVSVQLAANAVPGLTYQVETAVGKILLGDSINFGSLTVGGQERLPVDISNQTALALPIPSITVSSGDFVISGAAPAGQLQSRQTTSFQIRFLPAAAGPRNATLAIGGRIIALAGTGLAPNLPTPAIAVTLAQAQSAQQGSVEVTLNPAAPADGTGTLTLAFQPAVSAPADPAIAFSSGSLTANFSFQAGHTQVTFGGQSSPAFQTGTTAGSLIFTAQISGASAAQGAQQTVTVGTALVGLNTVAATRAAGNIKVDLDGFDNTRTAGALAFSFFDSTGNVLAGPIAADGTSAFEAYFQSSATGGSFGLEAVFPVTGDPARIASFTASVTNQAGTTTTARTPF